MRRFRGSRWGRWHRRRRILPRRGWFLRRLVLRTAILFFIAGGRRAYKLRRRDAARVEKVTGKPTSELTEKELKSAMKRLGIRKLELDSEEQAEIVALYCPHCDGPVEKEERFCMSCGASLF